MQPWWADGPWVSLGLPAPGVPSAWVMAPGYQHPLESYGVGPHTPFGSRSPALPLSQQRRPGTLGTGPRGLAVGADACFHAVSCPRGGRNRAWCGEAARQAALPCAPVPGPGVHLLCARHHSEHFMCSSSYPGSERMLSPPRFVGKKLGTHPSDIANK